MQLDHEYKLYLCQVTCQRQPALGGVFKLVSMGGQARMKLSQDVEKMTLPGEKAAFRLFGRSGLAILDLLQLPEEPEPVEGQKVVLETYHLG